MLLFEVVVGMLSLACLLTLGRLIWGPDNANRIVAAELLTGLVVASLAIAAWDEHGIHALDVAIGLGLVGFLASVGLASALSPNPVPNADSEQGSGQIAGHEEGDISVNSDALTANNKGVSDA